MSGLSYDLSLKLAPFVSVSLERTGATNAIVHVELDPRHAHLIVHILSLGIDPAYTADATGATYVAEVFALINDYDSANPVAAAISSTKRSFPVALSTDPAVKDVGIIGANPASTDANGQPLESKVTDTGSAISNEDGSGGGSDPLPINVVVRKARIPIPPGSGQTSIMVNVIVIILTFIAGVIVGQLLS